MDKIASIIKAFEDISTVSEDQKLILRDKIKKILEYEEGEDNDSDSEGESDEEDSDSEEDSDEDSDSEG